MWIIQTEQFISSFLDSYLDDSKDPLTNFPANGYMGWILPLHPYCAYRALGLQVGVFLGCDTIWYQRDFLWGNVTWKSAVPGAAEQGQKGLT